MLKKPLLQLIPFGCVLAGVLILLLFAGSLDTAQPPNPLQSPTQELHMLALAEEPEQKKEEEPATQPPEETEPATQPPEETKPAAQPPEETEPVTPPPERTETAAQPPKAGHAVTPPPAAPGRETPRPTTAGSQTPPPENREPATRPPTATGRPAGQSGNSGNGTDKTQTPMPGSAGMPALQPGDETDPTEYFTTTIRDGEVRENADYRFEVIHKQPELEVADVSVYLNEALQLQMKYRLHLQPGENHIRVAVSYRAKDQHVFTVYRAYTVYLNLPAAPPTETPAPETPAPEISEPEIITDLENRTVHDAVLEFHAALQGGSEAARLTVVCNGTTISGNETYRVGLQSGNNTIRLKATDRIQGETVTKTLQFVIRYVPAVTEETRPVIAYINVTDGMQKKGQDFILNVLPEDYRGSRIYGGNILLSLNGTPHTYEWETADYTSYRLYLDEGENTIDIRITDGEGRTADYRYIMHCTGLQPGEEKGHILISLDAAVLGLGEIIAPYELRIHEGETGEAVLRRFFAENGITPEFRGFEEVYLARLSMPRIAAGAAVPEELKKRIDADGIVWSGQQDADSLGEYDYTVGSGWMFSINGSFSGYSLSKAIFEDGDVVRLRFTLAYGKDIGGYTSAGGDGNYDPLW